MSGSPPQRSDYTANSKNKNDLLGVPKGYVPPPASGGPGQSGSHEPDVGYKIVNGKAVVAHPPLYHVGDESKPQNWGTTEIIRTQQKLVIAGYLSPNDLLGELGSWKVNTEAAYKALLEDANAAGITADAQFNRAASETVPGATVDPATGRIIQSTGANNVPPLTLQLPNRDDLTRTFRAAVVDKLGQGWGDDRINAMVDAYIWQTMQVQVQAHQDEVAQAEAQAAGQPMPTAVQVQPPSQESFADKYIMQKDPTGAQAEGVVDTFLNNASGFWKSPVG